MMSRETDLPNTFSVRECSRTRLANEALPDKC